MFIHTIIQMLPEHCDQDADLYQESGSPSPVLHTLLLSHLQRASAV